jgi:hypothetical protein
MLVAIIINLFLMGYSYFFILSFFCLLFKSFVAKMIKREGGGRGGKKEEEKEGERRQMMRFK